MPERIQIILSEELVRLYERKSEEGILATIFDPTLIGLVQKTAFQLKSGYPELNSVEHAEALVREMADPGELELPGGRIRLLIASYVAMGAE